MEQRRGSRPWVLPLGMMFFITVVPATAEAQRLVADDLPSMPRMLRSFTFPMGCVDGAHSGQFLDCEMSFAISFNPPADGVAALAYTGGHLHPLPNGNDPGRPIGALCSQMDRTQGPCPPLERDAQTPRAFHAVTESQEWNVIKTLPQVSGLIDMTGRYRLRTPGYYCIPNQDWTCDSDYRGGSARFRIRVAVPGLVELPPDPQNYIRCIRATDACTTDKYRDPFDTSYLLHPEPFFATPATIYYVQTLATIYRFWDPENRAKLRILDISLTTGGLMEDQPWVHQWTPTLPQCEPWTPGTPGHCSHREGKQVDISQKAVTDVGALVDVNTDTLDFIALRILRLRTARSERPLIHYNIPDSP